MVDFRKIVRDKIAAIGVAKAKEYFGVSAGTISNWSTGRTDPSLEAVEKVYAELSLDQEAKDGEALVIIIILENKQTNDSGGTVQEGDDRNGSDDVQQRG